MIKFRNTGYRSQSLFSDLAIGVFDGLDNALWCYAFATVIFAGALSVFLPLLSVILLAGWGAMGIFVCTTSAVKLHVSNLDEQSIVILAAIGVLMVGEMGAAAVTSQGLATMLAVMSLSSLIVAVSFILIGKYNLTRLLELLPYPVICGFMAGIGWLLLNAGVGIAVDTPISKELPAALNDPNNQLKLVFCVTVGIGLMLAIKRINEAWALPLASLAIVLVFYTVVSSLGIDHDELIAMGWLFDIDIKEGGALMLLSTLSLSDVDTTFILTVMPQILTIAFLALLTASMSLSALMAAGHPDLNSADEMENLGGGNILCSLLCCPPGYTDVIASTLYAEFGASSRWMPLASSFVCLLIAVAGGWVIGYLPRVLVGATVFLFAFQMLYEWMYQNVRGFQPIDYAIVCFILGTVIFVGFMAGILVGILLALLLFVLRYSMISAIHGEYSLADFRSSVERATASNEVLGRHGSRALVYTLRGFLFFGTANAILDKIRDESGIKEGNFTTVLLDLKRVTGIDISALNTFVQIKKLCEAAGVRLLYSGMPEETERSILMLNAVSYENGNPLVFPESDYAVEYMEEDLLKRYSEEQPERTIHDHLERIFDDPEKVRVLHEAMQRVECEPGHVLFEQGDVDTGLFMLEQGAVTAMVRTRINGMRRVKKFKPGAVIGEMSAYTTDRKRTATVIADEHSVLYHLTTEKLAELDSDHLKLTASIHELVARTLGGRIDYMNRRLVHELK